jgi:hypothetical protein
VALLVIDVTPHYSGRVGLTAAAQQADSFWTLRTGMDIYAIYNGRYPAGPKIGDALNAMGIPAADGPSRGLDAWGKLLVYWVSADGQHAMIYSCGPSGIDRHGAGDNIAIHCDIAPPTTATAPSTQPRWGN